jgi:uncharacterized repeat protein (TIGR02543 family)
MKRTILAVLLGSALALGFISAPAQASITGIQSCTFGGTFTISNGVVTGASNCSGDAVIPNGVTSIGASAFYGATSLVSITLPASVTSIGASAFDSATSLESVVFADGSELTSIGASAFNSATRLYNINIPTNVSSIGAYAFYNAGSLERITIPRNVRIIEDYTFAYAFDLQRVSFAGGSELEAIGSNAFRQTQSLQSIEIPARVTSIGSYAFEYTIGLDSITIPNSVTSIGSYAFYNSYNLESVFLGGDSSLTTIGSYAFSKVSSLRAITIPASTSSIGSHAFHSAGLRKVFFNGNAPLISGSRNFLNGVDEYPKAIIKLSSTGFANVGETWNGLLVATLHSVNYASNGGTSVNSNTFISFEEIEIAPPPPTRTNYIFAGWSATNDGEVIRFPYNPAAARDITLYAKWNIDPAYTAALDLTSRTIAKKKSYKAKTLANQVGIGMISSKATVSISISKASKKVCTKSGSKIKTLKVGNCIVTFTVQEPKPKKGKKPKATKTIKTLVVQ